MNSHPHGLTPVTHAALRRRLISSYQKSALIVLALLTVSMAIGMVGYHLLGPMSWVDAFVNAAMLLGGMGPVDPLTNDDVKVFAGFYALYCGVVFIAGATRIGEVHAR